MNALVACGAAVVLAALCACAADDVRLEVEVAAAPVVAAAGWRLVVLGTAQDGGLPHLGCVRPCCEEVRRGERPPAKVACLGLTDGESFHVFDATPDFPAQVHALGARIPDGVFLTHAHIGHYTGLVHLGREVLGGKDVPVYATPLMAHFLSRNAPWEALVTRGNIELRDNTRVDLGGVVVTAFRVPHRAEYTDTVGYRIEGPNRTAVFLPDIDRWKDWDQDVRAVVEGVDYAFLDATFFSIDELPHRDIEKVRHPLVTESMERLSGLGDRVWFLHMNHTNPLHADPSLAEDAGFHVAREGEVLGL